MGSHLGNYIAGQRLAAKLRIVDLARLAGLGDRAKALRTLEKLEKTGIARASVMDKVSQVLQLGADQIEQARQQDAAEYQDWLDEPVPMSLTIRLIPGFYVTEKVPPDLNHDQALVWALGRFNDKWKATGNLLPWKLCLNLSRRSSIFICGEQGVCRTDLSSGSTPAAVVMTMAGKAVEWSLHS